MRFAPRVALTNGRCHTMHSPADIPNATLNEFEDSISSLENLSEISDRRLPIEFHGTTAGCSFTRSFVSCNCRLHGWLVMMSYRERGIDATARALSRWNGQLHFQYLH